jgi:hypothetical protein
VTLVDDEADEEALLREHGAEGSVVNLSVTDEHGHMFALWMAIDPAQPVNSKARHLVVDLSALHVMCFGPVVLAQLDEDTERELLGG